MTAFGTKGHVALQVALAAGEVRIETADAPEVDVELVPLRDNDVTRQAIAEARVELTDRGGDHVVAVQIPKKSGLLIGRGPKVGVRVRCPQGSDLDLRSSSANLEATGTLGKVGVKTESGDVALEGVSSLQAGSASGDLRVRDVDGPCDLRTASGDASVGRCRGPLTAKLVSGDLTVAEAVSGLAVTTVSGDVNVEAAGGGRMRVQSVSGDVHLGIRPGERLYIDASSVSGTMSSELGVDDAPPADPGATVNEVRVRTVSGDLQIVRAAAVGA